MMDGALMDCISTDHTLMDGTLMNGGLTKRFDGFNGSKNLIDKHSFEMIDGIAPRHF